MTFTSANIAMPNAEIIPAINAPILIGSMYI
jgi:hypothetical protein